MKYRVWHLDDDGAEAVTAPLEWRDALWERDCAAQERRSGFYVVVPETHSIVVERNDDARSV